MLSRNRSLLPKRTGSKSWLPLRIPHRMDFLTRYTAMLFLYHCILYILPSFALIITHTCTLTHATTLLVCCPSRTLCLQTRTHTLTLTLTRSHSRSHTLILSHTDAQFDTLAHLTHSRTLSNTLIHSHAHTRTLK
jgi:hypothetical protein